jgi:hypothetical protein
MPGTQRPGSVYLSWNARHARTSLGDKTAVEQIKLIQELDPDDKSMIFKMIDTMLTKKKFKDFFNDNVAAL